MRVLITGANSGFGLLTARIFAEKGHTVLASYRSEAKSGEVDVLVNNAGIVAYGPVDQLSDAILRQ